MEPRSFKRALLIFSIVTAAVALLLSSRLSRSLFPHSALTPASVVPAQFFLGRLFTIKTMSAKAPVYFMSHGGPNTMFDIDHPVYPVLQKIGHEITQKVKPKAIVVFSAHWEAEARKIEVNTAEEMDLIYDYYGFPPEYYKVQYPHKGSPEIAAKVISLLKDAGIKAEGVTRGLDHGVYVGFSVAFHLEKNPLGVPIVQVSQYNSQDVDAHYRLGQAVSALRDENIVIIGAGMSVHNLRDLRFSFNSSQPLPYTVSFDEALKPAMEAPPSERQARLAEVAKRPDAHQAHPRFDHLMPAYITAGAAGDDIGKQIWTYHEASMGWAMYRFGEVPS
ncbi:Extradiol ring-cleavage dioxygenase, class III enzyme, subunit B [Xylariaceae sp. FL1651]|nr:Extradiol ring-cleavage dioxygenase, class III enzyme, subunit B [Xylariaceae sp. FL1651]